MAVFSTQQRVAERIRIIEPGIVLQDFSHVADEQEGLLIIQRARQFMEQQSPGQLVLTDVTGSIFTGALKKAMTELALHHTPWVVASALVGLSPAMRLMFRGMVALTGREIRALDSRSSAMVYLVARKRARENGAPARLRKADDH